MGEDKLWVVLGRDRQNLLDRYHVSLGHCSAQRLLKSLFQTYWWLNMGSDCSLWFKICPVCLQFGRPMHHAQLRSFPSDYLLELIAINVIGPFFSNFVGNQYVLSFVDLHSQYLELQVILTANSNQVVKAFTKIWIKRWGVPRLILTNASPSFKSVT